MIYLPIGLLKSGMVLASDVPSSNFALPFMLAGQTLSYDSIKRIADRGVKGLYIEYEGFDDIEEEGFLRPEEKQVMLSKIKEDFVKSSRPGFGINFRDMSKMAETIVFSALSSEKILCSVNDIRDYDNYTYAHCLSVGMISAAFGARLGLPTSKLVNLTTAGLLHDLGKLEIDPTIINKPGQLDDREMAQIRKHPMMAVDRLRATVRGRDTILQGIATHHEFYDGRGYPNGLAGEDIPLYGRILALVDVYDALCSNRSYRKAWEPTEIIDYLISRSGTQFDPELLSMLLRTVTAYPVGTAVRLSDGSIGVVVQNHEEFLLRPTVRIVSPSDRRGQNIVLSKEAFDITLLGILEEGAHSFF